MNNDHDVFIKDERYVVVTTVSQFRQRYSIPLSELQALNPEIDIMNDPAQQISWANDSVSMEEVKEFSQYYMGESIVDTFILMNKSMRTPVHVSSAPVTLPVVPSALGDVKEEVAGEAMEVSVGERRLSNLLNLQMLLKLSLPLPAPKNLLLVVTHF